MKKDRENEAKKSNTDDKRIYFALFEFYTAH